MPVFRLFELYEVNPNINRYNITSIYDIMNRVDSREKKIYILHLSVHRKNLIKQRQLINIQVKLEYSKEEPDDTNITTSR